MKVNRVPSNVTIELTQTEAEMLKSITELPCTVSSKVFEIANDVGEHPAHFDEDDLSDFLGELDAALCTLNVEIEVDGDDEEDDEDEVDEDNDDDDEE